MDISENLRKNREIVEKNIEGCDDSVLCTAKLGKQGSIECFLVYPEQAVENVLLENSLIGRMLGTYQEMEDIRILENLRKNGLGIANEKQLSTMEEAMTAMLAGNAVLFVQGWNQVLKIDSKGYPGAGVGEAESEKVIRGSREAFSESVKTNAALIRKRVRDTRLKVREFDMGTYSGTKAAVLYMEGLVYPPVLKELNRRLKEYQVNSLEDAGVLEHLTEEVWYSPFPQYQATERPDRAAMAVLSGQAVLLTDNSPEALLFPATLDSMFQTSDDYYRHFLIVSFLRMIRYAAAFLAVSLPGLYLAVTNFHTQILTGNLIFSFADARKGVPFPGLAEVLLLELSFELLREAGVRMPGTAGNTIGIVGGLIVGQAAVSANLASPIVVIVVAVTALGTFSIPNEELSEAFRLAKYVVLFLCAAFGILGLAFGWFLLLVHLAGLTSFGISYLMPYGGETGTNTAGWRDALIRYPMKEQWWRPLWARQEKRRRMTKKKGGGSR